VPELVIQYVVKMMVSTTLRKQELKKIIEEGLPREAVMRYDAACGIVVEEVKIKVPDEP